MVLQLDHVVIAVNDLEQAISDYETLGFTVLRGGIHANRATHNALIVFSDGTYLELLAATGAPPLPDLIDFSPMLAQGEGLGGFALRTPDIVAEKRRLETAGFAVGEIVPGAREKDGRVMRWKLALIEDGFAPFLIEDVTPREWRVPGDAAVITHENHAVRMPEVMIVVRSLIDTLTHFAQLFSLSPDAYKSDYWPRLNCVLLEEHFTFFSRYTPEELASDKFNAYRNDLPPDAIDQADPAEEPRQLATMQICNARTYLNQIRWLAEQERAKQAALDDQPAALLVVCLVREAEPDDRFALDRTHNVRFRQQIGVAPTQGMDILRGLDAVDWAELHYAHGPAANIPHILRAFTSENDEVRQDAFQNLPPVKTPPDTSPTLIIEMLPFLARIMLATPTEQEMLAYYIRLYAVEGLRSPDLYAAISEKLQVIFPTLLPNLTDPVPPLRRAIAHLLALYPSEADQVIPLLQARLQTDPDPRMREICLDSLVKVWTGEFGETSAMPLTKTQQNFISTQFDDEAQPLVVRFKAARILIAIDPARWLADALRFFDQVMAIDHSARATFNPPYVGGQPYRGILDSLEAHTPYAFEWVLAQTQHSDPNVRGQARATLRKMHRDGRPFADIQPALIRLLNDLDPNVRYGALSAFEDTEHIGAIRDRLIEIAEHDRSAMIRHNAKLKLRQLDEDENALPSD